MSATATRPPRGFFGHPPGLGYLAFTEAWERFSFYGMQTLLVLYMVDQLLKPGHVENVLGMPAFRSALESMMGPLSTLALSSMIFGLYSGLAYFLPVFGGLVGDRLVGQHRMVMAGAVLMAAGHFLMAFEAPFLIALLLLIVGSGCLKGNISTQVGSLYAPADRRSTDAFQIFLVGINVGVVAAPLVCGTLGEVFGWHYGFGAAGVGMLIGLVIYIAGQRHLPPDRRQVASNKASRDKKEKLGPDDWRVIGALLGVLVLVAGYMIPANQIGNIYPLWLKGHVDRSAFGATIPVTWFQSLTALISIALPPLLVRLWQAQAARGREPDELKKIARGCWMGAAAYGVLTLLAARAGIDGHVGWVWLIAFHLLYSLAYLFIWPIGLALFARAAPAQVNSMFIGIYFLSLFIANNIVGVVGKFYERMTPAEFWGMHAAIAATGAVVAVLFGGRLQRALAPRRTIGPVVEAEAEVMSPIPATLEVQR